MIRSSVLWAYKAKTSSEAICETVGSIMGMHCGKNRFLKPENFSKEIVLRFNLGPMHLLDGLVGEVLALNTTKSYLREAVSIGRTVTKDLNKSASIGSFQERNEKKISFPTLILAFQLQVRENCML